MDEISLPSSTFAEFVIIIALMVGLVVFSVTMAFLAYRKRCVLLKRCREELPSEVGRPLRMQLLLRPTYLLWIMLMVLSIWAVWSMLRKGFIGFEYNDQEIRLQYHQRSKPFIFAWSDITATKLEKKYQRSKWAIIIETEDGRVYQSIPAPTYREIEEIEKAYHKLKEAHEKSRAN